MATYADLYTLEESMPTALVAQVKIAMAIAANAIMTEATTTTNHTNRMALAKEITMHPEKYTKGFFRAILAANNGATIANIQAATDAEVLTAVQAAIDMFAGV